jgi:hypothetical protein
MKEKTKKILFDLAPKNKMQFITGTHDIIELSANINANEDAKYAIDYFDALITAQTNVDYPLAM